MPIDKPQLDECHARHQAELQERYEHQHRQFAAINAVIKARLKADCSSNDCHGCGVIECVIANKEYLKLWPENAAQLIAQEKEPVSAVRTTNASTCARASSSPAQSQNSHAQKSSDRPGQPVSGSGLFDLDYSKNSENQCE